MGLSCKGIGKIKSVLKKVENHEERKKSVRREDKKKKA